MRAALYKGPHAIEVGERPDPRVTAPTDADCECEGEGNVGLV
jgi:hypothetical protein